MTACCLVAVAIGFCASRRLAPPPPTCAPRSALATMGVSDRMANDGMLYDGWGAEVRPPVRP